MAYRKEGFTLVELLVVVAIIALLLGILLPAINKARSLARDVVCTSNQRQIGVAFIAYDSEFNQLPAGFVSGYTDWGVLINAYLGNNSGNDNYQDDGTDGRHPAMQCPSAAFKEGRLHYAGHSLLLPTYTSESQWDKGEAQYTLVPYPLQRLRRASEMLIVADSGQYTDRNGTAPLYGDSYATLSNLDNNMAVFPTHFYNKDDATNGDPVEDGPNLDGTTPVGAQGSADLRWRHRSGGQQSGSDGGATSVLFGDGHASIVQRGELTKAQIRPSIPSSRFRQFVTGSGSGSGG